MKIIRIFFIVCNIIVALVLSATYLNYFISPKIWWVLDFLALGYRIYLFVNIAFAGIWLFTRYKKYAFISAITIIVGFSSLMNSFSLFKNDSLPHNSSFKILSYNVKAFSLDGLNNASKTQAKILAYVRRDSSDILCFQEFHHDNKWKFVMVDSLRKMGYTYSKRYQYVRIPGRYFFGLITFSKYPIINAGYMEYQHSGNATLWTDIVAFDDTVRVFNNHLESYRLGNENLALLEETQKKPTFEEEKYIPILKKFRTAVVKRAVQTDSLIMAIQASEYPVIVCGDFNSPPQSYTYKRIKSSKGFNDAFIGSGEGFGGTFDWTLPSIRLDHILYPSEWESSDYKIGNVIASDHFPISCRLQVKR